MAVTASPRLGITRWSAGGDPFTRAQLDGDHDLLDDLVAIDLVDVFASRPAAAAGNRGVYFYASDTGDLYRSTGAAWRKILLDGDVVYRLGWTYTLPNEIKVPSGGTDFLPLVPISVGAGHSVTLVGYQWYLNGGTSFTFKLQHKTGATWGTNTDLVTGVVAASASVKGAGTFGTPKVCADADAWGPVITAVSGTPAGGAVTMVADLAI
jgi:hypothetical protein